MSHGFYRQGPLQCKAFPGAAHSHHQSAETKDHAVSTDFSLLSRWHPVCWLASKSKSESHTMYFYSTLPSIYPWHSQGSKRGYKLGQYQDEARNPPFPFHILFRKPMRAPQLLMTLPLEGSTEDTGYSSEYPCHKPGVIGIVHNLFWLCGFTKRDPSMHT